MRIAIDIGHPAHVHFFKNAIGVLQERGHEVTIVARGIPVALRLLDSLGLQYRIASRKRKGAMGLGVELAEHFCRLLPVMIGRRIDVCASIGGTFMVHAAVLARCKRVVFSDTETAGTANRITFPFANRVVTPRFYPHDLGRKHKRYDGFHELAYLHPRYFSPSQDALSRYGLSAGEPFSIVRLSSWEAAHDVGVERLPLAKITPLIDRLGKMGRVIIIPEGETPESLRQHELEIDPLDFHDLLALASYCVTEGATTASEACILGTPAVYLNPVSPCYIDPLIQYGLLERPEEGAEPLGSLNRLIDRFSDAPERPASIAGCLISDHCDVTEVIVQTIENS